MAQSENIKAGTLKEWLDSDLAVLIDVREPDEYVFEHIQGAINVPLASAGTQPLPVSGDKKIVIQCGTGNRSMQACGKIATGEMLYNLEGGLQSWKSAGFGVVSPEKRVLPIQRQVQIVVGSFVFLGTVLGYFAHAGFFVIPAFMGLGLLNAGLTGWCGMAKFLGFMPWNKG